MAPGVETLGKERGGLQPLLGQQVFRVEVAGVGIGIGKGEYLSAQVIYRASLHIDGGYDQIGVVKRFATVQRHGSEAKMVPVTHVRIAAQPGKLQFAVSQQIHYLPVAAALNEDDGALEMELQEGAPLVEEGGLI